MKAPLDYPLGGLSDNLEFGKQPPGTSPVLLNERSLDPKTGRRRGTQREGLRKFNPNQLAGTNPVRHIRSFTRSENLITYIPKTTGGSSTTDDEETYSPLFEKQARKKSDCRIMATDRQSNLYVNDGNSSIEKLSADGEPIWRLELPVVEREHVVRALDIDEQGNIYAAVSYRGPAVAPNEVIGGNPEGVRIWKYRQEEISEQQDPCKELAEPTSLEWEVEPNRWVERLKVRRGFLYTIQNEPSTNRAFLSIYGSINTSKPRLFAEREVPHPTNDISVGLDGSIYVASDFEVGGGRGINPLARGFKGRAQDWTLEDLTDAQARVYAWLVADDLVDVLALADDDAVAYWPDRTGRRHMYKSTNAPTLLKNGIGGRASVHFTQDQGLKSQTNFETGDEFVDQMRTLIPGNTSGTWAIFMVVRVPAHPLDAHCILNQANAAAGTIPFFLAANAGSTLGPGSQDSGSVAAHHRTNDITVLDGGHGANVTGSIRQPRASNSVGQSNAPNDPASYAEPPVFEGLDTDTRTFIVTYIHNGNQNDGAGTPTFAAGDSIFRVNGNPVDVFEDDRWSCTGETYLGEKNSGSHVSTFLEGDIAEIIVIHDPEGVGDPLTLPRGTNSLAYPDDIYDATQVKTEVHEIEGYLAWAYGIHDILPDGTNLGTFPYTHFFYTGLGAPPSTTQTVSSVDLLDPNPMLTKFDAHNLNLVWVLGSIGGIGGTSRGGVGYAVAATCDGNLWSLGPAGAPAIHLRYVVDSGAAFDTDDVGNTQTDAGAISIDITTGQGWPVPYIAVDKFNNVYVPFDSSTPVGGPSETNTSTLYVYTTDGVELHDLVITEEDLPVSTTREIKRGRCVAIDPNIPDYRGDLTDDQTTSQARAETIYVGTSANDWRRLTGVGWDESELELSSTGAFADWEWFPGALVQVISGTGAVSGTYEVLARIDDDTIEIATDAGGAGGDQSDWAIDYQLNPKTVKTIHRIPLVDSDENTLGSFREQVNLGVCNGNLVRFADTGSPTTVGTAVFSTSAKIVQSAEVRGQAFFTDGLGRYRVFRRVKDSSADEVAVVEAKKGRIPPRCKLMTTYRGRLVIAGDPNEPHNWYMSSSIDAYDWDFFPPVITATQAVAGNTPVRAGLMPDIVTCLIPSKDDTLIIGGDRSIHIMSGDPAAGGQIDLVSQTRGIAFGSPWAKDPEENVYFFGSKGGVFGMKPVPGAVPQRLSVNFIERRLQDIDLSAYRIEMAWDWRNEGLKIVQVPYGAGGTLVKHWFWQQKTASWHEDQHGNAEFTGCQPTCIDVLDGDEPGDRVVVIGCEDGYVRKVDEDAADDDVDGSNDPVPIYSRARIGPIMSNDGDQVRISALWPRLASDQQGCKFEVFTSDTADFPGEPADTGLLKPGNNGRVPIRGRGTAVWVELSNAAGGERWSYEGGFLELVAAGRSRVLT